MSDHSAPARGAVIGCGFFAANHLSAWREIPGADIVAVCDLDSQRAQAGAELVGGAKPYTQLDEMLRTERLDFVDIVTTMETHEAIIAQITDHAIPAILQKPLAPDLAAGVRIIECMQAAGVPLMVHENFRFQRPIRELQKVVISGAIGEPIHADIQFRTFHDMYNQQPYLAKEDRLIIADVGVHVLDLARFFLGEATSLYCRSASIHPDIRGEDMMAAMLGHENGATSFVTASYYSKLPEENYPQTLITVEGREGSVALRKDYELFIRSGDEVTRRDVSPTPYDWTAPPWDAIQESVLRVNEHWLECVRTGHTPETSGYDNLKTYRLAEASYASAASGQSLDPRDIATIPDDPDL